MIFRGVRHASFRAILTLVLGLAFTPAFAASKEKADGPATPSPSDTTQSAATSSSTDDSKTTKSKKSKKAKAADSSTTTRSEEHTSELQSRRDLVCRLL